MICKNCQTQHRKNISIYRLDKILSGSDALMKNNFSKKNSPNFVSLFLMTLNIFLFFLFYFSLLTT